MSLGRRADRHNDVVHVADVRSARKALGWCATAELDDGLARTVDWRRRHRAALLSTG